MNSNYGRVILGLGFLYSLFASSALGIPGVLILPMSQDLGMSIGELSAYVMLVRPRHSEPAR